MVPSGSLTSLRVRLSERTVRRVLRPYPKRLKCVTNFWTVKPRQHIILSYFKILSFGPSRNRTRTDRSEVWYPVIHPTLNPCAPFTTPVPTLNPCLPRTTEKSILLGAFINLLTHSSICESFYIQVFVDSVFSRAVNTHKLTSSQRGGLHCLNGSRAWQREAHGFSSR